MLTQMIVRVNWVDLKFPDAAQINSFSILGKRSLKSSKGILTFSVCLWREKSLFLSLDAHPISALQSALITPQKQKIFTMSGLQKGYSECHLEIPFQRVWLGQFQLIIIFKRTENCAHTHTHTHNHDSAPFRWHFTSRAQGLMLNKHSAVFVF